VQKKEKYKHSHKKLHPLSSTFIEFSLSFLSEYGHWTAVATSQSMNRLYQNQQNCCLELKQFLTFAQQEKQKIEKKKI